MMIIHFLFKDRIKRYHRLIQNILNNPLVELVMQQQANHHYINKEVLLYQSVDKL
jgi:hypothetical protein